MMSFNLYVQQNRWIVEAILAGTALMAIFCLTYLAMWRSRGEESRRESGIRIRGPLSFMQWVLSFMPWPLVLIIFGTFIYGIAHTALAMTRLPNW
jgi:Kef-type K+ transport system membrane component KefB